MKIGIIGGGPGGLYAAILLKKASPHDQITVFERNGPHDTFGFGIVLSEETLGRLNEADPISCLQIKRNFKYWDDLYIHYKGAVIRSGGHRFSGLERLTLLQILQSRALDLGVDCRWAAEISTVDAIVDADLIIAADGVNSAVRKRFEKQFSPRIDVRPNRFIWLGSTIPLPGFTFIFKEDDAGIWNVHSYQYKDGRSTFVVETTDEALSRAGLAEADEAESVAYLASLFREELGDNGLITNRSLWRQFPAIRCDRWHHQNVVLVGDAAHTAHFSIGSGTKLAMEDAIALNNAVTRNRSDIGRALGEFEHERRPHVEKIQQAADVSLRWFENVRRYWHMDPVQFTFNLLTRTNHINYENLELRDPDFIERVNRSFPEPGDPAAVSGRGVSPPMLASFSLRGMSLDNRLAVADFNGAVDARVDEDGWDVRHRVSKEVVAPGMIFVSLEPSVHESGEASIGVSLASDGQVEACREVIASLKRGRQSRVCLRIGRIAIALPASELNTYQRDIVEARESASATVALASVARRAAEAGFDAVELDVTSSPTLTRAALMKGDPPSGALAGALQDLLRIPAEAIKGVRASWPDDKPISVRIFANEWIQPPGCTCEAAIEAARMFRAAGCDVMHVCLEGANADAAGRSMGASHLLLAERIRLETATPVIVSGRKLSENQVNTLLAAGRADIVAFDRPLSHHDYVVTRRVRWGECDLHGIVYTPRFLDWSVELIESFHEEVLGMSWQSLHLRDNRGAPFVNVTLKFHKSLGIGDRVDLRLRVRRVGRSSVTWQVDGENAGSKCFAAELVSVIIDKSSGQAATIPAELRERVLAFAPAAENIQAES